MPVALTYHEQQDFKNRKKLRSMLAELPPYCKDYMRGIEPRSSSRTRIGYAYDLGVFFRFLKETNPTYKNIDIKDIPLSDLEILIKMKLL